MKWSNPAGHLAKVVKLPTERKRRRFMPEFKKDAVALVTEQGYSIAKAAQAVDTSENNLRRWKKVLEQEAKGERLTAEERAELVRLRRENKELQMEQEILKKSERLLCERNEVKYGFFQAYQSDYPVRVLCRVMQVGPSAYYAWRQRGAEVIDTKIWQLCQRMKVLFEASRQSLGSR